MEGIAEIAYESFGRMRLEAYDGRDRRLCLDADV